MRVEVVVVGGEVSDRWHPGLRGRFEADEETEAAAVAAILAAAEVNEDSPAGRMITEAIGEVAWDSRLDGGRCAMLSGGHSGIAVTVRGA